MSTLATSPRGTPRRSLPPVLVLAGLEARRLLRHPIFVIALALFAWLLVSATVLEPEPNLNQMSESWAVLTGFFLGVGGFLAMHRLTRSTSASRDVVGAVPLDEPSRTLALCVACLVPLGLAVLSGVWTLMVWEPGSSTEPGRYSAFTGFEVAAFHTTVLLAALGGPLLGVTVGRWWGWPTAGAVTAVGLIAWSVVSGVQTTGFWTTLNHMAAPLFVMLTGGQSEEQFRQGGSMLWRVPYVACLCALAALTAMAHGATDERRSRIIRAIAATGVLAVAFLLLATLTGPDGQMLWQAP